MKTIIAGSRDIDDLHLVRDAVRRSGFDVSEVVSGRARGVDRVGEEWAFLNDIPVRLFPANWDVHGKAAGAIRNAEMADYSEALIAVWDGKSKGTKNMIDIANRKNLKVYVLNLLDKN